MTSPALRSGPWDGAQVDRYLRDAVIPLRLATSGTFPLVQSLWFAFDGTALWCATQADSVAATRVTRNGRVGFEIAADTPPYRGVRGTGHATIVPERGADVLTELLLRYLGSDTTPLATWLLSRAATEVALRIDTLTVTSWDYSGRM